MNKSFSDSPASDFDLDTTLERNISHVIDILENEDTETDGDGGKEQPILKGVRAYVEVRTNNDNRSEAVSGMLKSHGAIVEKTFTDNVTHVIYKDGNKRTVDKAKKKGIHLVSVLWVDSCLRNGRCVSEQMYPAILPQKEKSTPIFFKKNRLKKMKSMQPNDFEHDVAKSSERYDKKKKKEEERLGLSGCSTPVASPIILAYDTVPRSPPSPSDWRSPIPLMIPNTPPSIKDTVNRLRQARLNQSAGSDCSGTDSPMIGDIPNLPPLHRKLFDGNEEMQTPSFNLSKDDHETSQADAAKILNKSPPFDFANMDVPEVDSLGLRILKNFDESKKSETVDPATILKRKLFNVLDKNSPKPYLLEPSSCSETVRPTLLDSPVFGNKGVAASKIKGQKRKADTDSENSGKEKNLKKKSKDTNVKEKPVKNIYLEHVLEKISSSEDPEVNGADGVSKGANSEQTSQSRSSRRSSILNKSNTSNSSLKQLETGRSGRRVSIATPDLPPPLHDNLLRRSLRRSSVISLKSLSETESPELDSEIDTSRNSRHGRKSKSSREQTPTISEEGGTEVNGIASDTSNSNTSNGKRGRKSMVAKSVTSSPCDSDNVFSNRTGIHDGTSSLDQPLKRESRGRKSHAVNNSLTNGTNSPSDLNSENVNKNSKRERKSNAGAAHGSSSVISNGNGSPCDETSVNSTKTVRRGRKSVSVKEQSKVIDVGKNNNQTESSSAQNFEIDSGDGFTKNSVTRRKSMRISAGSKSRESTPVHTPELDSDAQNKNSNLDTGYSKTSSKSGKASKSKDKTDQKSDEPDTPRLNYQDTSKRLGHQDTSRLEHQDTARLEQTDSARLEHQDSARCSHNDQPRIEVSHPDVSGAEMSDHPDLSRADMSDYPDSSRSETTGCLGASMSVVFGDITMPSFSHAPSRRSIDDFKLVNRKKSSTRAQILTSISESSQNSTSKKQNTTKSKKKLKTSTKRTGQNSENRGNDMSYELDESEKPLGSKVMLRRANSFVKEKNATDTLSKITRPSIVMTSMHSHEQDAVRCVIKKLGGFLLMDNVSDTTTHVICGDARRTLNLVNGVARGCWILKKDWVLKSIDEGSWLEEEDFEFSDVFPQAKINREERQASGRHYSQTIFTGIGTLFISAKTSPPRSALTSLIRLCGGEITGSASNCDIFIGNKANLNKTSIKPVWLLDCIMEHKLIDYNQPKYILNLNQTSRESSPEF